MKYRDLILRAKAGDKAAAETLLTLYKPLLVKMSIVYGLFDDDLYQELCLTLLRCVERFQL